MSAGFQKELRKVIEPYQKSNDKPPFAAEELVVIALVATAPRTQTETIEWILRNFRYYLNLALRHASGAPCHCIWSKTCNLHKFTSECEQAYKSSEPPLEHSMTSETRWTVALSAARVFLHNRHPKMFKRPEQLKPFPFMRLPPELRTLVYEYALGFPKPGSLSVVFHDGWSGRRTCERIEWRHEQKVMECPAPDQILGLLKANKQLLREAMPVFYSINKFDFDDVYDLAHFLTRTHPSRLIQLGHLVFKVRHRDYKTLTKAFKMLHTITHLRELDITIGDDWKLVKRPDGTMTYPSRLRIPGIATLRSLRGLKAVRFHGDCEEFHPLASEMTQDKEETATPKKRKQKADGESSGRTKVKKAKVSKSAKA